MPYSYPLKSEIWYLAYLVLDPFLRIEEKAFFRFSRLRNWICVLKISCIFDIREMITCNEIVTSNPFNEFYFQETKHNSTKDIRLYFSWRYKHQQIAILSGSWILFVIIDLCVLSKMIIDVSVTRCIIQRLR